MEIDDRTVEHTAKLARLALEPAEIPAYRKDLEAILRHVEVLKGLDLEDVEPLVHVGEAKEAGRADVPIASLDAEEALGNAPERKGPHFSVPRVLE